MLHTMTIAQNLQTEVLSSWLFHNVNTLGSTCKTYDYIYWFQRTKGKSQFEQIFASNMYTAISLVTAEADAKSKLICTAALICQ